MFYSSIYVIFGNATSVEQHKLMGSFFLPPSLPLSSSPHLSPLFLPLTSSFPLSSCLSPSLSPLSYYIAPFFSRSSSSSLPSLPISLLSSLPLFPYPPIYPTLPIYRSASLALDSYLSNNLTQGSQEVRRCTRTRKNVRTCTFHFEPGIEFPYVIYM